MTDDRTGIAAALVRLARERDPAAWGLLVERCGPASERLARRLTGDAVSAQDAVQEAWLQIRDGAGRFTPRGLDPDAGAWGWIMRVTANATAQQLRRRGREPLQPLGSIDPPAALPSEPADPALLAAVRGALGGLPEDQRSAVVLHHVAGLDFVAIAAALGCSPAAAKKRAQRGLERLRSAPALRRALPALSLLIIAGLLRELPAAEGVVAHSAPLASLLSSSTAVPQGTAPTSIGMSMALKLTLCASAVLILVAGGALLSQESQVPAPVSAPGPAAGTARVVEVVPLPPAAPDPAVVELLARTIDPPSWSNGPATYRSALDSLIASGLMERNFAIEQWVSGQWLDRRLPAGTTGRQVLDALADQGGAVWRVRGRICDVLPRDVADALAKQVGAAELPHGGWEAWAPWISTACLSPARPWIDEDLDRTEVFAPRGGPASAEDWLRGLAVAGNCFLRVSPTGEHGIVAQPRNAQPEFYKPMPDPPGLLTYNPPPPALMDRELAIDYRARPVAEVLADISFRSGVRIEVDHDLRDDPPITMATKHMSTEHVLDFVASQAGLEQHIEPTCIRLSAKPGAVGTWRVVTPRDDALAPVKPESPATPTPTPTAPGGHAAADAGPG